MKRNTLVSCAVGMLLAGVLQFASAAPQGLSSAFTYQGYLEFEFGPVNQATDMRFSLYDEEMGGTPIAGPIVFDGNGMNFDPVDVVNGYFTVTLDFGTSPLYSGNALWLEIEIRQHLIVETVCTGGTSQPCVTDNDCPPGETCQPHAYYLLEPRTSLTGTPHALGLRYPQTGRAEFEGPMFTMIQRGKGSVLEIESAQNISVEGSSPTFLATNRACGVAASISIEPPPGPCAPNEAIPALVVTNRANGVAASFYIPDPDLPIEDGCPPQCPPFPWPWVDVVAPGIDVINQSGGPAGRFATDSDLLLPAVHVSNSGMGMAVQAANLSGAPTLEAMNNGGGSAGKFEAVAFNPQPDPPSPALVARHQGGGGAAKFESYAFNPQPDPPMLNSVPTIEVTNNGGGSAGKFSAVAFNPQPDPPGFPAIDVIHGGGGSAGRFTADTESLLPAILVTNTGNGMACQAVSQGTAAAMEASNMGTGPAMKALSNNSGGWAFEANNAAGAAIKAVGGNGVCFDGEGDLRVTGNIQRNYGNGSPSYHGTSPIAYASINSDGTVAAGTPNLSCSWNLPAQRYDITITGEAYSTTSYVTTATPVATAPAETLFANTSSGLGQLRVRILGTTTGTVGQQKPFHVIVYKP